MSTRPGERLIMHPLCAKVHKRHELSREPSAWPEVHRRSCKGTFSPCVSSNLHLDEWTRHIVDLSYFVTARTVHSSGCRLQLTSKFVSLKTLVIRMMQPRGKFLNCAKVIIVQISCAQIKLKSLIIWVFEK